MSSIHGQVTLDYAGTQPSPRVSALLMSRRFLLLAHGTKRPWRDPAVRDNPAPYRPVRDWLHSFSGVFRRFFGTALVSVCLASCGCDRPKVVAPSRQNRPPVSQSKKTVSQPKQIESAAIPSRTTRQHPFRAVREHDWFDEASQELGVDFTYRHGSESGCYELIESVGGGAASFDYDADGLQDLFFTGGGSLVKSEDSKTITLRGRSSGLFRLDGRGSFVEVSSLAGIENDSLYTHGCTVLDCDADGFDDLLVAGYRGVLLWRNQGDGTFRENAVEMGLTPDGWNVTAAAADYDRDGLVDVYLLTYANWAPDPSRKCLNDQNLRDICGPTLFPGSRDAMFRNTGEGFANVTDQVGLVLANRGLGIVAADLDQNGYVDFAVVNDVEENQLYLNGPEASFQEMGVLWGIALSETGEREGSMGIDLGDFNGDGFPDLWYTNYAQQDNSLLRNAEGTGFVHSASLVGLAGVSRQWVGFGTLLTDLDGDGWDDIFVANGHVAYERRDSPYYQPPQLFKNERGRRFLEVSRDGGPYFEVTRSGRGVLKTDVNEDGAWDIVVVHQNEPVALLRNRHPAKSWIKLDLVGTHSDRNAIGAVVSVRQGERILKRWKVAGGSYLSHSDPRLLFALQDASAIDVTVTWLGGRNEVFEKRLPERTHILVEGRGRHVVP